MNINNIFVQKIYAFPILTIFSSTYCCDKPFSNMIVMNANGEDY